MGQILLVTLVAIVVAYLGSPVMSSTTRALMQCGPNEKFTPCGSWCPPRCDKLGPRSCIKMCFVGCRCQPGFVYLKGNSGPCIPRSQCPKKSIAPPNAQKPNNQNNHKPANKNPKKMPPIKKNHKKKAPPHNGPNKNGGKKQMPARKPMKVGKVPQQNIRHKREASATVNANATMNANSTAIATVRSTDINSTTAGNNATTTAERTMFETRRRTTITKSLIYRSPESIVCGRYARLEQCGTACPLRCEMLGQNEVCPLMCVYGCSCYPGYVFRQGKQGDCILPSQCPQIVIQNLIPGK